VCQHSLFDALHDAGHVSTQSDLFVQAAAGAVTLVRDSPHPEGSGEAVQGMHGPAEPHLRGGRQEAHHY